MSDRSAKLSMPFIQPSQAQKHITHNQAISALDVLVQMTVLDHALATPPLVAELGDSYIVATDGTDAWVGQDGAIATKVDGGWEFAAPQIGWRAFVVSTDSIWTFAAAGWGDAKDALNDLNTLGLGAIADSANPFTARINSALWTAKPVVEGGTGSVLQVINKDAATNDAGFVFQTGYSAKAIVGTFGADAFRIAASSDGSTFKDALVVDPASGAIAQPNLPKFHGFTNYDNMVPADTWTKVAINDATFNDQNVLDTTANHFVAPSDGTYHLEGFIVFKRDMLSDVALRIRMVKNGTDEIFGTASELFGKPHISFGGHGCSTFIKLVAGDTVELQGYYGRNSGMFRADRTVFWGFKVG
jgi:hypothetical protein